MSEGNSTAPPRTRKPLPDTRDTRADTRKPGKPRADFPLFAHATGRWAKKICGRLVYFGPWSDPDGAEKRYEAQKDALHAGRKPRTGDEAIDPDAVTVKRLVNRFLNAKQAKRDAGELSPRTWDEYKATCDLIVKTFGKPRLVSDLDSRDFEKLRAKMAKRWGPVRLGNEIQRVRTTFKLGAELLKAPPITFGPEFVKPSASVFRRHRAASGGKMLTAEELRKLLDAADVQLRAMLLLGLNAGFGNHDCAMLPLTALDLDAGFVTYARPKTGIDRRAPLWPETVATLRQAIAERPEPANPDYAAIVFITSRRRPWIVRGIANPISVKTRRLMKAVGIHRRGIGHYSLRHVFRTIADEIRDEPAIDLVMGHKREGMGETYRERIGDDRLRAVVSHVRAWLFAANVETQAAGR